MLFLEHEYCSGLVLHEETLGVGGNHLAFNSEYLSDLGFRCLVHSYERGLDHFTELYGLTAFTCSEEHIIDPIHAAELGLELDAESLGSFRESEIRDCTPPVAGNICYTGKVVINCRRPRFTVGGELHSEIGGVERIGGSLAVSLCSERQPQFSCSDCDILDSEPVWRTAEQQVVFSRTVIL